MSGPAIAIFIGLIVIGAGIFIAHSDLTGKLPNIGSLVLHGSATGTSGFIVPLGTASNTYEGPQGPGALPATTIAPPVAGGSSQPGQSYIGSQPVYPNDIPQGFTLAQLSPYFHKVRLGGVSGGSNGQISLTTSLNQNETIDVTGWEIRANHGGEFMPQAVLLYNPIGTSAEADIILGQSDMVNIYPRSAPVNLRLNKCSGYLNNTNQFNPPLYSSCPGPNREEIQFFTGACQNYILSLGGCTQANLGDPRIPRNDPNCVDYISNHFTYRACIDAHRGDADFFSHEVRVWAGGNPLDPFHDRVLLLDANGLLVDSYQY